MALTRSSVLHYWSSRYGINPRIGGRPVFTRNSAGLFTTQEEEVNTAIVNTPRFDWSTLNLPSGQTERRKVLTLEPARTNNILHASDFTNGVWTKNTCTVTPGIGDPAGGASACRLTATGAGSYAFQSLADGASIARANSLWVRRYNGGGTIGLYEPLGTAPVVVPSLNWQRFSSIGAPGVGRFAGIYIDSSGDAVDVWLQQIDDAAFPTSGIQTTSAAATRATDALYWNFPPVPGPQAMMAYVRFEEGGSIKAIDGPGIFDFTDAAGTNPRFLCYNPSGFYGVYHHNASAAVSAVLAAAPALGDTVELVALLTSAGAVGIIQSINGAAVSASALSGANAIGGGWGAPQLQFGRQSTALGSNKFAELKVVKYADVVAATNQGVMDELRALELGPNGDIL